MQIKEEIYKLMIAMCPYEYCEECPTSWCYAEECATMAICKGYRKIDEGSVVLTEEEFNEFQEDSAKVKFLKKEIEKQAIKEFAERLKEEIEQAIKSNYIVIKEVESSTIIYQWCKGKIDALRGIDNYIDEVAKKMGAVL